MCTAVSRQAGWAGHRARQEDEAWACSEALWPSPAAKQCNLHAISTLPHLRVELHAAIGCRLRQPDLRADCRQDLQAFATAGLAWAPAQGQPAIAWRDRPEDWLPARRLTCASEPTRWLVSCAMKSLMKAARRGTSVSPPLAMAAPCTAGMGRSSATLPAKHWCAAMIAGAVSSARSRAGSGPRSRWLPLGAAAAAAAASLRAGGAARLCMLM